MKSFLSKDFNGLMEKLITEKEQEIGIYLTLFVNSTLPAVLTTAPRVK